jgi:hypothetical protein
MDSKMPTQKKGFKRIMGEIPEEMYAKITIYNKISDRPLNVSKSIELCIAQAIKKIDDELIGYAAEVNDLNKNLLLEEIDYDALKNEVKAGLLGPKILRDHALNYLVNSLEMTGYEDEGTQNRVAIFPIDRVDNEEKPERLLFYSKNTLCFSISPVHIDFDDIGDEINNVDDSGEMDDTLDLLHEESLLHNKDNAV